MSPKVSSPETPIPETWTALAKQWGVASITVTRAARSSLLARGNDLPGYIPGPRMVEPAILEAVQKIVLGKSQFRTGTPLQETGKLNKISTQRKIRECLDKHEKLLGEDIIETVADELGLPLSDVREVLKQRWEARKLERKILAEMAEEAAAEKRATEAREAALARKTAEDAERAKPRPAIPVTPLLASKSEKTEKAEPAQDARAVRPTGFPQRGENVGFDETLRAAWIAMKAGLPDVLERTVSATEELIPGVTFDDVKQAIEAAYWERPEGARKTMEKRAERLKGESR